MTRRKSKKNSKPLQPSNSQAVSSKSKPDQLYNTQAASSTKTCHANQDLDDILAKEGSHENVENCPPIKTSVKGLTSDTADLYNDLDSFRSKWKRELEENRGLSYEPTSSQAIGEHAANHVHCEDKPTLPKPIETKSRDYSDSPEKIYAKARKLFLTAVELEQDEMHYESIQYYKQAMHLCPDIEKQVFQEQCLASTLDVASLQKQTPQDLPATEVYSNEVPLITRMIQKQELEAQESGSSHCRPQNKLKNATSHISHLPTEVVLNILRYVVGEELDLASLEKVGMVCRGFFILSRDTCLWRSICYQTWGDETKTDPVPNFEWRKMFIERPRLNYDGVYISRTRYIRQGDVGFVDLTYRPFHVVRYYRYIRFFPDGRVLILTTNEEPDRIIPIFRHALNKKQFSSELSILEGKYEYLNNNQVSITAEKDLRSYLANYQSSRRHEIAHWVRQTPHVQKFILKFKLDTIKSKPHRNNSLKWLEYTILARFETGQEVTSFDLTSDSFPSLFFCRVKKFNLKLTKPLPSH